MPETWVGLYGNRLYEKTRESPLTQKLYLEQIAGLFFTVQEK